MVLERTNSSSVLIPNIRKFIENDRWRQTRQRNSFTTVKNIKLGVFWGQGVVIDYIFHVDLQTSLQL